MKSNPGKYKQYNGTHKMPKKPKDGHRKESKKISLSHRTRGEY